MTATRYILRRFNRGAAFLGLAAWTFGTALMLWGGRPEVFQRLGALGVAASVLFFTDRLSQIELGRQRSVEKILNEYGIELSALTQGTDPQDMPQYGYVVEYLTEERYFDHIRRKSDLINAFNVFLMKVATLQWGFRDIFHCRFVSAFNGVCQ